MSIKLGDKTLAGVSEMDNLPAERVTATDPQSLGFTNAQGFIDVASEKLVGLEDNFLTASKSVYVDATNGDDTTGDGSQEKPWATIQKAVDECPSVALGSSIYNIYLTDGQYDTLNIYHKYIGINAVSQEPNISFGAINISSGSYVIFNIPFTIDTGTIGARNRYFDISNGTTVIFVKDVAFKNTLTEPYYGLRLTNNSMLISYSMLSFDRAYNSVYVENAKANLSNVSTTNIQNSNDIIIKNGRITLNTLSTAGNIFTDKGGRIEFGSQGWRFIGSVTGANSVAIDSELYTEFLVKIKIPNTIVEFEVHLCSTELTTTAKRPSYGCMFASNDYYGGSINATNTSIKLDYIWRNGVSITDTTTMTVYGKR